MKKEWDDRKIKLPNLQVTLKVQTEFESVVDGLGLSRSVCIEEAMKLWIEHEREKVVSSNVSSMVG